MSIAPARVNVPVTASVVSPAVTSTAAKAVVKKPAARKAAAVTSHAVAAKASAPAKAAPPAPAVKTSAPKVAVQAAVKKSAIAKLVKAVAPATSRPATKNSVPAKAAKKPKLVRDSFTIPKNEYVVLENLKQRAAQLAQPVKKSELLGTGIKALAALSNTAFHAALKGVPAIKTGSPTSDK